LILASDIPTSSGKAVSQLTPGYVVVSGVSTTGAGISTGTDEEPEPPQEEITNMQSNTKSFFISNPNSL
jgi:hypothetical protein